jgi:holo-[acyl-carrier protein] synthase
MAPLLRTGVDLVDVDKVARMIELSGRTFLEECWTPAERLYCVNRPERFASRWAAKEATMKALGEGVGAISPLEVEVSALEGRIPELVLRGNARRHAEQLGLRTWSLSLSHEGHMAIAVVIGLGSIA